MPQQPVPTEQAFHMACVRLQYRNYCPYDKGYPVTCKKEFECYKCIQNYFVNGGE